MANDLSRRTALMLSLASGFATLAACQRSAGQRARRVDFATLDEKAEPLRDDFNRGAGNVRLLLLMDPICPTCLRGLADIDRDLLTSLPSGAALKTYIVHEPVIGGKATDIAGAASLVHAPVRHYWNPTGSFGRLAGTAFDLHQGARPVYAWDVWTIYGPEAVWKELAPPPPRVLMHQLGALNSDRRFTFLDSKKFAAQARALLASAPRAGVA